MDPYRLRSRHRSVGCPNKIFQHSHLQILMHWQRQIYLGLTAIFLELSRLYTNDPLAISARGGSCFQTLLRLILKPEQQTSGQLPTTRLKCVTPQQHSPGLSSCLVAISFVVTSAVERSQGFFRGSQPLCGFPTCCAAESMN